MTKKQRDDIPTELADFPVVISLPVQWGDEDSFGHVNNAVHIRWFESGRIAYLEQSGLTHMLQQGGVGPILVSIACHYRRQLNYPDTVSVGSRVARIGRTSITIEHVLYSQAHAAAAADGHSVVVMFDFAAQRPQRVPDEVRQALERLDPRT